MMLQKASSSLVARELKKIGTPQEIQIFSIIIYLQIHTTYAMLSSGIY